MKVNTVIKGDVVKALKKLPDATFQTVIADPPYYNVLEDEAWDTQWKTPEAYLAWCEVWVGECLRVLKEDGLCFIFGQLGKREHTFIHLMSRLCHQHAFHDLIIWDRAVGYNERRDSFTPQYEMILVLRKSEDVKFNKDAVRLPYDAQTITAYLRDPRYKDLEARKSHLEKGKFATNILRVPSLKGLTKEKCGHPSQKPLALITKLVACASDENDLVLDPFLGSGTTAIAAEGQGRQWMGIECNAAYTQMARQRLKKFRASLS
ncbi:site-specific DNA-methyltransferase (adenine-specific) [Prosthecobacter fusiformis]|uniref:Methyltransferase n=1 Tax=Prosthecobacter fusiformis TaxID=48464 RepID=A0A4R7S642_9BACT|nr:site-specific DNA-methyltransferase [Prosthecobacter fusiformis]TDU73359.1 site-specific DNA-methyltransferase (adenine-specific) [Prosthecobacter fusiformis]